MIRSLAFIGSSLCLAATVTFSGTVDNAQRMLNQLGYNAGPVDGAYGKKTRGALEAFYTDTGRSFDGVLDDNEINDLQAEMIERDIAKYVPLSSLKTEYAMMANPDTSRTLVPLPRESRNVGQGVFGMVHVHLLQTSTVTELMML